jgi:hypothetical protein
MVYFMGKYIIKQYQQQMDDDWLGGTPIVGNLHIPTIPLEG